VDVSVNSFDRYDSVERAWLTIVDGGDYLSTIERCIDELDRRAPRFDLCLYNAGMDPVETCAIGGVSGITPETLARRERLIFDWARARRLPLAFVLAGGYIGGRLDEAGLVGLHRLTLATAAGNL
jgi:acetoin utilization deacetylase AcuC-like enzyme